MNDTLQTGRVLHAVHEGVHVLRFIGEIRHPLATALERCLDQMVEQQPAGVIIELSETRIIDSTCLGLLARLALQMSARGLPQARLVSPHADITDVLRSMSFDRLFEIIGELPFEEVTERELETSIGRDEENMLNTMLSAHKTLMALSDRNRAQFKDVVEALEQESLVNRGDQDLRRKA